jgi:hypothetical protein
MPPPRKTHLEALIEKAPVESKGFFFIEHPSCRASVVLRICALNPKARDSYHRLKPGLDPQGGQGTGVQIMRKLFILVAVTFALVSTGAATVVTTALTSDAAMALALR